MEVKPQSEKSKLYFNWGLGIGDWGLGIGPIPNPHFVLITN